MVFLSGILTAPSIYLLFCWTFASCFPQLIIYSVEVESDDLNVLIQNTEGAA
jgi:hypothetical protein